MTLEAILALSADDLPRVLAAAGFAPHVTHANPAFGDSLRALPYVSPLWKPQACWDDAVPLLEALQRQGWTTCITWLPCGKEGYVGTLELLRHGQRVLAYYARDDGPEMVCRAVLRTVKLDWKDLSTSNDVLNQNRVSFKALCQAVGRQP